MERDVQNQQPVCQSVSIEICAGKTDFPHRPMTKNRFLIGAGSNCDLQLGGNNVPMVHTLIAVDGSALICESVVSHPPLFINGQQVRSVELNDSDELQIGPFQFRVHITEAASSASLDSTPELPSPEAIAADDADDWVAQVMAEAAAEKAAPLELEQLSAYELIELIEKDHELIEEFSDAVEDEEISAPETVVEPVDVADEAESVEQTSSDLLHHMSSLAHQLEARAKELAEKEQHHASEAAALLDAQKRLSMQLEQVVQHLTDLNEPVQTEQPVSSDRKIA